MRNNVKVSVLLKGGLGNQLFQIAAGLYLCKEDRLQIFENFTLPRQTNGVTDALYFSWPQEVEIVKTKSNRIERKILALSLNQALGRKILVGSQMLSRLLAIASDWLFTIKFRERTHVISGQGVGFFALNQKPKHNLLNGYFQAHQFPFDPIVRSRMSAIKLKEYSPTLLSWIEKAQDEQPIVVHLRLGDYKNEHGIGVLTPGYYKSALRILEEKEKSRNIWIFTNEIELVERYISPPTNFSVRVIGEDGLTPADTLELMRYGSAYVIANSTFSWWAAFLSYQNRCTTIMPSPWFQKMPSPVGIKPQDWIEIEFLSL
jgi:hypothetical protein